MRPQGNFDGQSRDVQRLFDGIGEQWGARYTREVQDVSQLDLLLRADLVRQMLAPSIRSDQSGAQRLLDIGCGTGHVLRRLSDPGLKVVGMDFAEGMVRVAAAEHPGRRFLVGDARQIPVPDASVDLITIIGVIEYVIEHERVFEELARVLKPGGSLVLSVPNASSLFRGLHDLERFVTSPLRRRLGRSGRQYRQHRWSERALCRTLASHGFAVEGMEYCTYGLKTPRLEGLAPNIAFCRWASLRYHAPSFISRRLAWTLVALARRTGSGT